MRVTTLKASTDRLDGLLAYYAGLAEDRAGMDGPGRGPVDYYLDPNEPAGRWFGHGLDAVGLGGEADGDDLRALLEGRHPQTGKPLGRRFGDTSARGFDATFSAPKSVSALWAVTPDRWVRAEVLAAHDAAVDAALGWFESHGAVTRRGRDGIPQVDTQGIAAALFRQHTSRSMDPQLHTHAVIAAKVQDGDGRWLSLDARFLKYQQRSIGWIYDTALRTELTARLGVAWEPVDGGQADLTAVPDRVRTVFSQRSAQVDVKVAELIDRWSTEHDGADPDPRTIARLERSAVLASRPTKTHGIDATALHDTWTDQAAAAGLDLASLTPARLEHAQHGPAPSDTDIVVEVLRRASQESASWLRSDLARHTATLLPPNAAGSASDLVERIDQLATRAEARCFDLSPHQPRGLRRRDGRPVLEHVTDHRLTTAAVINQEQRLQRWARASTEQLAQTGDDPAETAVAAMAGAADLVIVVGPAGTGKTTATAAAVAELNAAGRPVVGLAPSGKAADVLAVEAGCPTETLAGFLTRHTDPTRPAPPPGTTVILDEAGMASTEDLTRLVNLAHNHQWRLVTVGDPNQLPAVGRGGVFAHWCNTLPHVELTVPRRFTNPWEAQASLALRNGDPDAAHLYNQHDRLRAIHPALLARQIADLHQRHSANGMAVAVTTNSADTARTINQTIQQRHQPTGGTRVELSDGTAVGIGDRIATRRNDPDLRTTEGDRVRNRHTWTVAGIETGGALTVTHPDRGVVTLPAGYVAAHVELGWAVTGYGNQGDTVDVGIAVLEPGTSRNHAYVALTRGRHTNIAYLPDPTGTRDPAEQLAGIITRPATGDSALTTHATLRGTHPRITRPPNTTAHDPARQAPQNDQPRNAPRMRM